MSWCPDISWVDYISKRVVVRCPTCNKSVLPSERYCVGGEFVGYRIPRHKKKGWKIKQRKERNGKRKYK